MKLTVLVLIICLTSCDRKSKNAKSDIATKIDSCNMFPRVIDSLKLKSFYDSARLSIYIWQCDREFKPKSDSSISMTFGELPLEFKGLELVGDTLELYFDFVYLGERVSQYNTRDNITVYTGVGFKISTEEKLFMASPNGFLTKIKGENDERFKNAKTELVNKYIENFIDKIDACFRMLIKE